MATYQVSQMKAPDGNIYQFLDENSGYLKSIPGGTITATPPNVITDVQLSSNGSLTGSTADINTILDDAVAPAIAFVVVNDQVAIITDPMDSVIMNIQVLAQMYQSECDMRFLQIVQSMAGTPVKVRAYTITNLDLTTNQLTLMSADSQKLYQVVLTCSSGTTFSGGVYTEIPLGGSSGGGGCDCFLPEKMYLLHGEMDPETYDYINPVPITLTKQTDGNFYWYSVDITSYFDSGDPRWWNSGKLPVACVIDGQETLSGRWDPVTFEDYGLRFAQKLDYEDYSDNAKWATIALDNNWNATFRLYATADDPATRDITLEVYGAIDGYPSAGFEAAVKHIVQDTDTNITMSYSNDTLICSYTPVNNANTSSY